jgi:hypothetical protein
VEDTNSQAAAWRSVNKEIEEEQKQIPLITKNNIVNKPSLQALKRQQLNGKIAAQKQELRVQAHEALSSNPAVKSKH